MVAFRSAKGRAFGLLGLPFRNEDASRPFAERKATMSSFTRWPWWRKWFGQRSERAAARYLRRLGYRILGHNLADKFSELDLLALDGDVLVFVEVRSTESGDIQKISASINAEKQRRLTNAALRFIQRKGLKNVPARFDVLVIRWPADQREPEIHHYRNAFQAVGRFQMYS